MHSIYKVKKYWTFNCMGSGMNWVYICLCLALQACTNTGDEKARQPGPIPKKPLDSSAHVGYSPEDSGILDREATGNPMDKLLVGKHDFTLQWVGWNNPGTVVIEKSKTGWYPVSGQQRDNKGNYVKISGKLKPVSSKELLFDGTIETRVDHINGGKPCLREGEQTFLATKGRQYWRLQQMLNCEGNMVTDYVDIYFAQK